MSERTTYRRAAALAARRLLKSLLRCRCGKPLETPAEIHSGRCRYCAGRPAKAAACRAA